MLADVEASSLYNGMFVYLHSLHRAVFGQIFQSSLPIAIIIAFTWPQTAVKKFEDLLIHTLVSLMSFNITVILIHVHISTQHLHSHLPLPVVQWC